MLIPLDNGGVREPFCLVKVCNQTKIYEKSDEPKEFPEGKVGKNNKETNRTGFDVEMFCHNLLNLIILILLEPYPGSRLLTNWIGCCSFLKEGL